MRVRQSDLEGFVEQRTTARRELSMTVREAQAGGLVPDTDPRALAIGVLGAVSSFSNAWRGGNIEMSTDELAEFVADWVERALR